MAPGTALRPRSAGAGVRPGPSLRVLLAADAGDAQRVQEALAGTGAAITRARRLAKALGCLRRCRFDVVLLAPRLPDAGAPEALHGLHEAAPGIPIILIGGRDEAELGAQALKAGAADYLPAQQLVAASLQRSIRHCLERQRGTELLRRRAAAQAALAALGRRALAGAAADALAQQAAEMLAEHLAVECSSVTALLPEGGRLLLRAGCGWPAGRVGRATVDPGPGSQAGHTLERSEPVVAENLAAETRFAPSPILRERGIVSSATVIIGSPARPWGVLGAHSTRRRAFGPEDLDFLEAVANVLGDAAEREQGERARRESEAHFRNVIDGSLQGIFIHRDFRPLFVNRALARMLGYDSPEQALREMSSLDDHLPPHERRRLRGYWQARVHGERAPVIYEFDALRRDGTPLRLQNFATVIEWQGAPAVQGTFIDVTRRHDAEQQALGAERMLADAMESMPAGFALYDADDRLVLCNARYRAMYPRIAERIVPGVHFQELIDAAVHTEQSVSGSGARGAAYAAERLASWRSGTPVLHRTSEGRWIEARDNPTAEGGHICIRLDVTERREADQALRQSSAILEATFQNIEQGISVYDAGHRLCAVNHRALELLEVPEELMRPGMPMEALFRYKAQRGHYGPGDAEAQVRERLGQVAAGRPYRSQRTRPDGTVLEIVGRPLPEGGWVITHTDVSERVLAERALRESEDRLRAIIERTADAMLVLDSEGCVELANPAAEVLLGRPREEIVGAPFGLVAGAGESSDVSLLRPDGSLALAEMRAVNTRWHGRRMQIVSIRDMTERLRAVEALREHRERLSLALEAGNIGTWGWRQGRQPYWDERLHAIFGLPPGPNEGPVQRLLARVHREDRPRLQQAMRGALQGTGPYEVDFRVVHPDGTVRDLSGRASAQLDERGRALSMSGVCMDVTERKRAESALLVSEERYRALYDNNPSMYFTVDAGGRVLSVNRFGAQRLGFSREEITGTSLLALVPPEERELLREHLQSVVREPERLHFWEIRKLRRDGQSIWVRETARAVRDDDGGVHMVLLVCEDITEARELSEEISWHASHDPLTGLANRREFERALNHHLYGARVEHKAHALCYLDLDQFKVVNDTCGHVAGDELLRQLSAVLQGQVRKHDLVARVGGDEFAVLMVDCTRSQAMRTATVLRDAVAGYRFLWEDRSFSLGVSIGLVGIDEGSESVQSVLSAADTACYAAKEQGRGRVSVYNAEDADVARRHGEMQWVSRIHRALEEERFRLVAQRIAPLAAPAAAGEHWELLLRMIDERGDEIPPGAFLPAAERFNLASRVDRWVVKRALAWLGGHPAAARLHLCAINLSGQSVGDEEFLDYLVEQIERSRVTPGKLCFEVTETAAISNLARAAAFIERLRGLGCSFALDDFGSGLSSFAYLKNLPVDFLKIDGVFVRDIVEDPIDLAMVRSINDIGHVMSKHTIAEFVESEAVLTILRTIGVDYAQGYHVGMPTAVEGL